MLPNTSGPVTSTWRGSCRRRSGSPGWRRRRILSRRHRRRCPAWYRRRRAGRGTWCWPPPAASRAAAPPRPDRLACLRRAAGAGRHALEDEFAHPPDAAQRAGERVVDDPKPAQPVSALRTYCSCERISDRIRSAETAPVGELDGREAAPQDRSDVPRPAHDHEAGWPCSCSALPRDHVRLVGQSCGEDRQFAQRRRLLACGRERRGFRWLAGSPRLPAPRAVW